MSFSSPNNMNEVWSGGALVMGKRKVNSLNQNNQSTNNMTKSGRNTKIKSQNSKAIKINTIQNGHRPVF